MSLRAFECEDVGFGVLCIVPLYPDEPHGLAAFRARRCESCHAGGSRSIVGNGPGPFWFRRVGPPCGLLELDSRHFGRAAHVRESAQVVVRPWRWLDARERHQHSALGADRAVQLDWLCCPIAIEA